MIMSDFYVTVHYRENEYQFSYASEAYIFHLGLYNGVQEYYGFDDLLRYTAAVQECYIKDNVCTPLGALADYVAEHWNVVKEMSPRDILYWFYNSPESEVYNELG